MLPERYAALTATLPFDSAEHICIHRPLTFLHDVFCVICHGESECILNQRLQLIWSSWQLFACSQMHICRHTTPALRSAYTPELLEKIL